jgi:hypothetical protein
MQRLSGVVHGSYSSTMQLYVSGPNAFLTSGDFSPIRLAESVQLLAEFVAISINTAILVAMDLEDKTALSMLESLKNSPALRD